MKSIVRACCVVPALCWATAAVAGGYGDWGPAVPVDAVNSTGGGGCPIETEDGLSLLIASGRGGGQGQLDIWVTDRESLSGDWSTPANLPGPVNTADNDLCPTPARGRSLFFVSDRTSQEQPACGGGDMYLARQSPEGTWSDPELLGCAPDGPNFPWAERSPSLVETRFGTWLFYSSSDDGGDFDLFWSRMRADGTFGPGYRVRGVNTADADDIMPNVRVRENGILEMVFSSNRMTGQQDVYVSFSSVPWGRWSAPRNLGENINTADAEQRATLSADGTRLYFGRLGGVWVSERTAP